MATPGIDEGSRHHLLNQPSAAHDGGGAIQPLSMNDILDVTSVIVKRQFPVDMFSKVLEFVRIPGRVLSWTQQHDRGSADCRVAGGFARSGCEQCLLLVVELCAQG
ncbi:hypothetical protein PHYPSEUDO_009238 [Phytophthora pseudosyringae]|uniref:Uncharacterized protein n=1 Tax=Phytophthora pseudosyringae TaxID=221518 RepID=A0A8T1VCK8_9STRA|nr:hypothetical protein PHYPSEUDO_009238 [Phytophthora pseudosyringae]